MIAADLGRLPGVLETYKQIPYGDTLGHFVLMGIFAFLATWVLKAMTFTVGPIKFPLGALIVLSIVVLEEASQIYIPTRNFSFLDLSADILGIVIFGYFAHRLYQASHANAA